MQMFEIRVTSMRLTSSVFSSEANNLLTFIVTGLGWNDGCSIFLVPYVSFHAYFFFWNTYVCIYMCNICISLKYIMIYILETFGNLSFSLPLLRFSQGCQSCWRRRLSVNLRSRHPPPLPRFSKSWCWLPLSLDFRLVKIRYRLLKKCIYCFLFYEPSFNLLLTIHCQQVREIRIVLTRLGFLPANQLVLELGELRLDSAVIYRTKLSLTSILYQGTGGGGILYPPSSLLGVTTRPGY